MTDSHPTDWNIHHVLNDETIDSETFIMNRTNHPVERFQRLLMDSFPVAHPNMLQFIETIKQICNRY